MPEGVSNYTGRSQCSAVPAAPHHLTELDHAGRHMQVYHAMPRYATP